MSLKLRMISHGLLAEAKGLDRELLGTGGEESESSEDVQSRIKRIMDSYEEEIKQRKEVKIRGLARDYRQQLVSEYMKSIPTKKCMNCNVVGEKYRQEGYSKIFRVPLTRKDLKNNRKVAMLNEDDEERLASSATAQKESNATYVRIVRDAIRVYIYETTERFHKNTPPPHKRNKQTTNRYFPKRPRHN